MLSSVSVAGHIKGGIQLSPSLINCPLSCRLEQGSTDYDFFIYVKVDKTSVDDSCQEWTCLKVEQGEKKII